MPRNSELLLELLRTSPSNYKSTVLEGESELPVELPADPRLAHLHDAKILLLESIFLWEYYDLGEGTGYDNLDEMESLASSFGAGLMDMVQKQQTLEEGKVWDDSSTQTAAWIASRTRSCRRMRRRCFVRQTSRAWFYLQMWPRSWRAVAWFMGPTVPSSSVMATPASHATATSSM